MKASEALWSQDLRSHVLAVSEEMHAYYEFLYRNGWFDPVVDMVLDEILEMLVSEDLPPARHVEDMKLILVQEKPERAANAIFRYLIDDTLEKIGTAEAGPLHWVTFSYYWFRWGEGTTARMRAILDELPEYFPE
ncbi:MAG: hypothetical protein EA406_13220 [Rhodospirillales bacterium]|nr:MAG: hypothetical protein EA406_13220 [Rhodospirillales bacterium]